MQARPILILLLITTAAGTFSASAQDKGTLNPQPLPPLENPKDPKLGAKELFARKTAGGEADARDRRLHQGLHRRRRRCRSMATPGR